VPIRGNPLGIPKGDVRIAIFDDEEPFGYYAEATSFPPNPKVGWRVFRLDIRGGMEFRWNGTYWLSVQSFTWNLSTQGEVNSAINHYFAVPQDLDLWVYRAELTVLINTPNNASNYVTFNLRSIDGTTDALVAALGTSAAMTQGVWQRLEWTGSALCLRTLELLWLAHPTGAGAPGTINEGWAIHYRLRAT